MGYANSMNFQESITFDNLYKGLKSSCRNVRWKDTVVGYEANGLRNTYLLRQDLIKKNYKIQPYQKFKIYEPKERDIMATRIRDRQFQHALTDNVLYEDFTRSFIRDNCACQKGRGIDDCLHRLTAHMRRKLVKTGMGGWVLKCDIRHYFQSIPHEVAKQVTAKRVKDERARQEVYRIIDSFGGDRGLGLGSQISQLIALAVLDDMDHLIKERLHVKYYVRYMDDFVLIHENKEYLKYCRQVITEELKKLGLELNDKTTMYPFKQGIKMLKWHFVPTLTGRIVKKMDRKKIRKQKKRIRRLYQREAAGKTPEGTANQSMQSWMANARRGDTFRQRKEMARYYFKITGGISYHGYCNCRAKACPT